MIETEAARAATEEILRLNAIPAMVSKDLADVLAQSNGQGSPAEAAAPSTAQDVQPVAGDAAAGQQQAQEAQAGGVPAAPQ